MLRRDGRFGVYIIELVILFSFTIGVLGSALLLTGRGGQVGNLGSSSLSNASAGTERQVRDRFAEPSDSPVPMLRVRHVGARSACWSRSLKEETLASLNSMLPRLRGFTNWSRSTLAQTRAPPTSCADRHPPSALAYRIVGRSRGNRPDIWALARGVSERFAVVLAGLGVGPGDRVATWMGKSSEYLVALMGIWRLGAVHVPIFTAFAPASIVFRRSVESEGDYPR